MTLEKGFNTNRTQSQIQLILSTLLEYIAITMRSLDNSMRIEYKMNEKR